MKTPDGKTELVIGVGATLGVGSDSYPYTVVGMTDSGKTIQVVQDISTPDTANGYDYFNNQIFTYSSVTPTEKNTETARWSAKRGCYRLGNSNLHVGARRAYQNPSF